MHTALPTKLSSIIFVWDSDLVELEGLDEAGNIVFRKPGFKTNMLF